MLYQKAIQKKNGATMHQLVKCIPELTSCKDITQDLA